WRRIMRLCGSMSGAASTASRNAWILRASTPCSAGVLTGSGRALILWASWGDTGGRSGPGLAASAILPPRSGECPRPDPGGSPCLFSRFPKENPRFMVQIRYTMMTEQAGPRELVDHVVRAEEAGFDFSVTSDHSFPWLRTQGHA